MNERTSTLNQRTAAFGWAGTVLDVDLTTGKTCRQPLAPDIARKFIGGRGLNSWTLFREVPVGADPLGPENIVCIAGGPLTATGLTSTSRVEVSTLSPLSGILGDGNAGGSFATFLKKAGLDQIVIRGASSEKLYLFVDDGEVRLLDAQDLWGKSTWETTDALVARHGKDVSVLAIGQAGENLVRFASSIVDRHNSAARGSGAVLGSKGLKAVVVRGKGTVAVADPDSFGPLAAEDRNFMLNDPFQREVVAVIGSHIGMGHWFPGYRNNEKYLPEEEIPEELRPQALKKYEVRRTACLGCVVPCKDVFKIPEGPYAGEIGKAMEHECPHCLGTNCGVTDPVALMTMENLADKYGMCVIGLGNAVALAKDLFNRGIISTEDTDGLDLSWENADDQIELLHRIARREGFGSLIAEGMLGLARHFGDEAMALCYHVKGLSRGPQRAGIFGLAHATSTRGADHLRGRSWAFGENDPDIWPMLIEKGYIPIKDDVATLAISELACTLTDMIGRCKGAVNNWASAIPLVASRPLFKGLGQLLSTVTGVAYDEDSLTEAAERVYLLEMAFNATRGIRRKDDRLCLPYDLQGTEEGERELEKHQAMLDSYYAIRGCDGASGMPRTERLRALGLEDVAKVLESGELPASWEGPTFRNIDDYPSGGDRA